MAEDCPEDTGGKIIILKFDLKEGKRKTFLFILDFVKPFWFLKRLILKPKLSRQLSFKSISSSTFYYSILLGKVEFIILSPSKVLDAFPPAPSPQVYLNYTILL